MKSILPYNINTGSFLKTETLMLCFFYVNIGVDGGTEKVDVSRRYIHWW